MTNLFWTFQHRVMDLPSQVLLALAGVTIAAGLFVWLGGIGLKKIMFVIVGLYFGAFFSLFYADSNPMLAAALIGICAVLSFKLQETFLVLVASAFAAIIGYSFLVRPYFRPSSNLMAVVRQLTIGVPFYNWPILLAITALPFAILSWQGALALLSSAAGAALVFAGTFMILLSKGFEVTRDLNPKREIFLGAFALAIIIGTAIQMWLLPMIGIRFDAAKKAAKAKVKAIKAKKGESGDSSTKSATWRTA